ncbi:hypothetical protein EGW08_011576, partial [Elysia chlorotica]
QSRDEISPPSSPAAGNLELEENRSSPPSFKDSQISIESEISSQSSLQQKDKMKASDWASMLQRQTTPVKGKGIQELDHEDSAKKKKKFASGSLADRLYQIQRRLKSSARMWYHSAKTEAISGKPEKEARSITVQVQSVDKMFSLYLCNCKII